MGGTVEGAFCLRHPSISTVGAVSYPPPSQKPAPLLTQCLILQSCGRPPMIPHTLSLHMKHFTTRTARTRV